MDKDVLRIVRGNDFTTRMRITAVDAAGNEVEGFSLEDSTGVEVYYTVGSRKVAVDVWTASGADITINWSDLGLGGYGFEISGVLDGSAWRMAVRLLFRIVASNECANVPAGTLVDGVYVLDHWLYLLSGGGGGGAKDAVLYTPQTLTYEQQAQARANIGAEQEGGAVKNLAGSASDTETRIKAANNPNLQANIHLSGNNIYVNGIAGGIDLDNNGVNIKAGNSGYPNANVKVNGEEVATKLYVDGKVDDRATSIEDALALIEAVIPSQASAQNQLADKNFVNSSISSSTANFVGTFNSLAELQAVQNPTNNDYGFVIETDAVGNEYYDRYKYNGTAWLFEYKVESTPFTAAQWAAIQSGITSALVDKLSALPTNAELTTSLDAKADKSDTYTKAQVDAAIDAIDVSSQIAGKADKVANATNGDFAGLDAQGNLVDSGKKASDFATAAQGAKADAAAPQATTYTKGEVDSALAGKQETLESAVNIKTINGNSLLGAGDLSIGGGGGSDDAVLYTEQTLTDGQKTQARTNIGAQAALVSGTNIKTVGGQSILGSGDVEVNDIASVVQTTTSTESSGVNVVTVTMAGGTTTDIEVRNGAQGAQGEKGDTVVVGSEDTYTLYNTTGYATNGAMTQSAVTKLTPTLRNSTLNHDLDVVDSQNNVLVRFAGGHIQTKGFNSQTTPSIGDAGIDADLSLADGDGHIIAEFIDGGIRVKNFDSRPFEDYDWLRNKKVAILGDSISTNGNSGIDANVPEMVIQSSDVGVELSAYLTYYDVAAGLSLGGHTFTASEIGTEVTFTPVAGDVGKAIGLPNNYNSNEVTTWWEHAASVLGFRAIPVCWSGSSITTHDLLNSYNTGSNAHKMDCSYAWHESQIRKCGVRVPGSMQRTAPDVIIIYRGTNDFSHASNVLLTELLDETAMTIPQTDALDGGMYGYQEGFALTIQRLRAAYPFAKIVVCTLNTFKRVNYAAFPVNNGHNTLPQWNDAIRKIADYFGCGLIDFDKDGITFENIYPTYASDSSTTPTHPNDAGHLMMGKRAIKDLLTI